MIKITDFINDEVTYDKEGQHFYVGTRLLGELRGWAHIQSVFTSYQEAAKFQDELGEFIADAINEKLKRFKAEATTTNIKWQDGSYKIFGEINGLSLFYIKDRNMEGLDKYELSVKFLDQRWTSDDIEELKLIANEQLHNLIKRLHK